jgi:hypothetical protein
MRTLREIALLEDDNRDIPLVSATIVVHNFSPARSVLVSGHEQLLLLPESGVSFPKHTKI